MPNRNLPLIFLHFAFSMLWFFQLESPTVFKYLLWASSKAFWDTWSAIYRNYSTPVPKSVTVLVLITEIQYLTQTQFKGEETYFWLILLYMFQQWFADLNAENSITKKPGIEESCWCHVSQETDSEGWSQSIRYPPPDCATNDSPLTRPHLLIAHLDIVPLWFNNQPNTLGLWAISDLNHSSITF